MYQNNDCIQDASVTTLGLTNLEILINNCQIHSFKTTYSKEATVHKYHKTSAII